jgi:hypothetical protein
MTGTLQRHRVLFVLLAAAAAFVLATAMSVTTFGTPMSTAFAQEDNGDDDNGDDDNGEVEVEVEAEAEAEAEAETEAAPVGGIDAGFGGTAGAAGSAAPIAAAAGLLAAGAAGAVALRRRAIAER